MKKIILLLWTSAIMVGCVKDYAHTTEYTYINRSSYDITLTVKGSNSYNDKEPYSIPQNSSVTLSYIGKGGYSGPFNTGYPSDDYVMISNGTKEIIEKSANRDKLYLTETYVKQSTSKKRTEVYEYTFNDSYFSEE